jgi:hypothetical protein
MKEECAFLKQRTKERNCPASRRAAKAGGSKTCCFEKQQQRPFGRFDFGAAGDAGPGGSNVFWRLFFEKAPLSCACLRFGRHLRATGAVTKKPLSVLATPSPDRASPVSQAFFAAFLQNRSPAFCRAFP